MRAMLAVVLGAVALASCCIDYDVPRGTTPIRQTSVKPAMSEADRIRASQAKQCAQRHVDRANGILDETEEVKRDRDEICAAHYRGS
jgi:outer membrane murein-binding lipoprotein Lpp